MRALGITSKTRSPLLPNLPTMGEQGYPAVEVLNWQGLIGPKGLPAEHHQAPQQRLQSSTANGRSKRKNLKPRQ